jgi:hypothetical protein
MSWEEAAEKARYLLSLMLLRSARKIRAVRC